MSGLILKPGSGILSLTLDYRYRLIPQVGCDLAIMEQSPFVLVFHLSLRICFHFIFSLLTFMFLDCWDSMIGNELMPIDEFAKIFKGILFCGYSFSK